MVWQPKTPSTSQAIKILLHLSDEFLSAFLFWQFGNKWFQPQEASNLRNRIRALLLEEFESARLDNEEDQLPSSSGCSANCEEKDDPEPDVVESIMLD